MSVIMKVVLFLAASTLLPLMAFAGDMPKAGAEAPGFTLNSQEGKPVSLKDFRGKWVVLYFYPKDFTGGCTLEAHNFQRDHAQYEQKGVTVLGVSADTTDSHKQFCAKEGLNFKLLADTDLQVAGAYGSVMHLAITKLASRHTFIINPEGKIVKVYEDVSPAKHSEEVLAALAELQK